MDLIFTDAKGIEQGVLQTYALDLSFGNSENDFELTLGKSEPIPEDGGKIYFEGTEYGGIIGGMKSNTEDETRSSVGRTWHGVLNSKIIEPDAGEDYLTVSGDANAVLAALIARLGLSELFSASESLAGVTINKYKFARYVKGYDGLRAMLAKSNAKLKLRWTGGVVLAYAEPIVDYTEEIDGDIAPLTVERHAHKVNHLICLGAGNLAEREVIHLYADANGNVVDTPYYTGLDEITDTYDYSSAQSSEELRSGGVQRLKELRNIDNVELTAPEETELEFDIGDIIGGKDIETGNAAKAPVTQKIVKINNGTVNIEYKTETKSTSSGGTSSGGGGGGGGGVSFTTDDTLTLDPVTGVLSVNTADAVEKDNTLPVTSAAVYTTVGNIELLLSRI